MRRTSLYGLITLIACACAMLPASGLLAAEDVEPPAEKADAIAPAKRADTQDDAIKLAKGVDLPAIAKANKVVIKQIGPDESRPEGREITIGAPDLLKQIRAALVVEKTEPSGGETKYTLTFYLDDKPVRELWVYDYGEWGLTLNQGPEWTLGRNEKLADLIDDLLERADNPSVDDTDDDAVIADDDGDDDGDDDAIADDDNDEDDNGHEADDDNDDNNDDDNGDDD